MHLKCIIFENEYNRIESKKTDTTPGSRTFVSVAVPGILQYIYIIQESKSGKKNDRITGG